MAYAILTIAVGSATYLSGWLHPIEMLFCQTVFVIFLSGFELWRARERSAI